MNWRLLAIPASTIPLIIIIIQFDIKAEDVFAVGLLPFLAAVLAMMGKLFMQGLKFGYIVRKYFGPIESVWKLSGVKVGSEFIRFTTPMFVGGEFVLIYWLHKKGFPTSKASWVAILEIVTDVIAGGSLSIIAGVLALLHGAIVVGGVVLATSITVTTIWVSLFFLSTKKTFQIPSGLSMLIKKFGKEKGVNYIQKTNQWMEEICIMSRENLRSHQAKKIFVYSLLFSIASWLFYGVSFMVIAYGAGYVIDFFDSLMAVMAANAIGNLPITVGGSGLAEFGVIAYLNNLDPFNFEVSEDTVEWNLIIAWRIATYYVPIGITWLLLVKFALSKYTKAGIT